MRVKTLELEISWPSEITIFNLRKFILDDIRKYGYPLRWAITQVKKAENSFNARKLFVEAVVIIL